MPVYKPGENVPCRAAADVLGGRFVVVTGQNAADGSYKITHAGTAGLWCLGVSERDAEGTDTGVQKNNRSMVNVVRPGAIARVTAGAAIDASGGAAVVKTDNAGRAIAQAGSGIILGYALTSSAQAGDIIEVALV